MSSPNTFSFPAIFFVKELPEPDVVSAYSLSTR